MLMKPRLHPLGALALVFLTTCLLAPVSRAAQSQTSVTAHLTTGVVKLGGDVKLIIDVENARSASIEALPAVDGLKFGALAGPSLSESISLFNGRQTQSRTLTWMAPLQPQRKGDFTIPSINVQADGRQLSTRELTLKVVEDLQGEELGLFEVDAPSQVAEGQPFTLELRFGWDSALERQLNYANLSLPWMGELPGVIELDAPASVPNAAYVELNLNSKDRIKAERIADRTANGHAFQMLRIKKRYLATRPGKLEFPTSHFEFGQVDDMGGFFNTRQPARKTFFKRFPGFDIEVIKLPEQGRPLDFTGAVGTFQVTASADRRDVDAGESIKLTVEWTGDGNLEFFELPDPARNPAFENFRVYGTNDRKSYERRSAVYDIAPISPDVKVIPPIPLRVYDPVKKAYVTISTDPIPIHVRPLKNGASLAGETRASSTTLDIRDIQTGAAAPRDPLRPGSTTLWVILGAVPLGWLALRTIVRRSGDPDAPRARARRRARKRLARDLAAAKTASAEARALQRFLAARTGETEQSWIGRDVLSWSQDHSVEGALAPEAAHALAQTIERLDERTYARGDEAIGAPAILDTADRLLKGGL